MEKLRDDEDGRGGSNVTPEGPPSTAEGSHIIRDLFVERTEP
jgi:hypothetical protein